MQHVRDSRSASRLPLQHGAWAMLLAPYAVGAVAARPAWVHLPLLIALVAGYLASRAGLLALKTHRLARYRSRLVPAAAVAAAAAVIVVAIRPALLGFAALYLPLLAVNAWYAARRDERSVGNDLAFVAQACAVLPMTYVAGGGADLGLAARLVLPFVLYFVGAVLYVKTVLRERGNPRFRRWSLGWHTLAVPVGALIAPALGVLFAALLARAALVPPRARSARAVGVGEVAATVALVCLVVATVARG